MRRWMMTAALLLAMGTPLPAWADDTADCLDPGDTLIKTEPARVVSACRRLADQGNAVGQYNLGWMYYKGQGVPQNYAEAIKWFRKSADQGDAYGQSNLGVMYANGQGVPQDYVQAEMWFNLAANQGNTDAAKNRDKAAARMTPAQIEKAQALAAAWKPTTGQ